MNSSHIETIFARFSSVKPTPQIELVYTNAYTLLVAVVLSAQATDVGVNKATAALFAVADTPQKMVALGEAGLKPFIKTIGLYNSKAKYIIALSQQLIDKHQGQVPHEREALESLSGVGRKSANVILNVVFGEPTMAVDTHIFRISNRIGLVNAKNPLETERQLMEIVPAKYLSHAHHWLVLHGRYVCKARKPLCRQCLIADICEYPNKSKI
ncbi:MAG: endonuclease III [Alphaproteobacteria bacterium]